MRNLSESVPFAGKQVEVHPPTALCNLCGEGAAVIGGNYRILFAVDNHQRTSDLICMVDWRQFSVPIMI